MLEGNQAVEKRLQHPNNALHLQGIMQQLLSAIEDVSPYTHANHYMAQVEQEESIQTKE